MANITKTQIIKRAGKIADQINDGKFAEAKDELESLKDEVRDEADNIEPYDGKDDLTPQQEERQEWLNETADALDSIYDEIESAIDTLNEQADELNSIG